MLIHSFSNVYLNKDRDHVILIFLYQLHVHVQKYIRTNSNPVCLQLKWIPIAPGLIADVMLNITKYKNKNNLTTQNMLILGKLAII